MNNQNDNYQEALEQRGVTESMMNEYHKNLEAGFPYLELHANAEPGKSILIKSISDLFISKEKV